MGESQELPAQLGAAKITWGLVGPQRDKEEIQIAKPFKSLTVVANGLSCVVEYEPPKRERGRSSFSSDGRTRNYFFGTDSCDNGKPFLTGVSKIAINELHRGGEAAFFDVLMPRVIKKLSAVTNAKPLRQGDIYAVKVGPGFIEATEFFSSLERMGIKILLRDQKKSVGMHVIFGTRHSLSGDMIIAAWLANGRTKRTPSVQQFLLVQGKILAPDHDDMILCDGVYAVAKSNATFVPVRVHGAD
jgi:hypothetical protein